MRTIASLAVSAGILGAGSVYAQAPSAPVLSLAGRSGSSVSVSYTVPPGTVTGYTFQWAYNSVFTNPGVAFSPGFPQNPQAMNIPCTEVWVRMKAKNGTELSAWSNVVSSGPCPCTSAPAAPTNLVATQIDDSQVKLTWVPPPSTSSCGLSAQTVVYSAKTHSVASNATSVILPFFHGITTTYAVKASNGMGEGPLSNAVAFTPVVLPTPTPTPAPVLYPPSPALPSVFALKSVSKNLYVAPNGTNPVAGATSATPSGFRAIVNADRSIQLLSTANSKYMTYVASSGVIMINGSGGSTANKFVITLWNPGAFYTLRPATVSNFATVNASTGYLYAIGANQNLDDRFTIVTITP